MSNIEITNVDLGNVVLAGGEWRDELLTLAGADVIAEGTILARDSVSQKLVLFVKGGATNENGIPKMIITYEAESTGAGDLPIRAAASGSFIKNRLIIDADGDDSNVDNAVIDQLRDYGLVPVNAQQLAQLDNQ